VRVCGQSRMEYLQSEVLNFREVGLLFIILVSVSSVVMVLEVGALGFAHTFGKAQGSSSFDPFPSQRAPEPVFTTSSRTELLDDEDDDNNNDDQLSFGSDAIRNTTSDVNEANINHARSTR
jgi:hypothetical protein